MNSDNHKNQKSNKHRLKQFILTKYKSMLIFFATISFIATFAISLILLVKTWKSFFQPANPSLAASSKKPQLPLLADSPTQTSNPPPSLSADPSKDNKASIDKIQSKVATVGEDFLARFTAESQELDVSQSDAQTKAKELLSIAQNLKPEEIHFLALQSTNMQGPANSRILGVYILSLLPETSLEGLLQVVLTPLTYGSGDQPHSPEEALAGQEKAVRRVALNSLIKLATQQNNMASLLREKFKQIPDEELKEYALKSLDKI